MINYNIYVLHVCLLHIQAGVAEFPDSNAHIYVVPTSEFSHQLGMSTPNYPTLFSINFEYYYSDCFSFKGLTDRHYPNMLHAIILKRLPKEGMILL